MKARIEPALVFLSCIAGALKYTLYEDRTRVVSAALASGAIALSSMLCAGLIYKYLVFDGKGTLQPWGIGDLTKSIRHEHRLSVRLAAAASIALMSVSLSVVGFWAGFVALHVLTGR